MALNSASLAKCQKVDGQPVDLMDQHSCYNQTWETKRQPINNPTTDIHSYFRFVFFRFALFSILYYNKVPQNKESYILSHLILPNTKVTHWLTQHLHQHQPCLWCLLHTAYGLMMSLSYFFNILWHCKTVLEYKFEGILLFWGSTTNRYSFPCFC